MNRKEQLQQQLRLLVRDSREAISTKQALILAGNTQQYNSIKKELETYKDHLIAPKRLDSDDIIYIISDMMEDMVSYTSP